VAKDFRRELATQLRNTECRRGRRRRLWLSFWARANFYAIVCYMLSAFVVATIAMNFTAAQVIRPREAD